MTAVQVTTRPVEVRCKACGCVEHSEQDIGFLMTGRAWELVRGYGALRRFGGCTADCRCHVEARHEPVSPFEITFGAPRSEK